MAKTTSANQGAREVYGEVGLVQSTAFGEVSVAEPTPVVQIQFPYNINTELVEERSNGGTLSISSNRLKASTGASANQSAQAFSITPIKYNPGQGGNVKITALFTTGVVNSSQYIGVGDAGDGYFFGFNGADFGILRRQGGTPEIRTLTITTKSTTAEDITITLDGNAKTDVTVTDATSGDTTTTANDIGAADFSGTGRGWKAHVVGSTVIFVPYDASSRTGTYSLSGVSAVGSFAQTLSGAAPTETFTKQTAWNEDRVSFSTDPKNSGSGVTFDPAKGNVFVIQYQWLGFGIIKFFIENPETGDNILVHSIKYANTATVPSVDNPTLSLCLVVENTSNTSDIIAYTSSMAGFVEGQLNGTHVRHGASVEFTGVGVSETPLLTIQNKVLYQGKLNKARVKLSFTSISVEGAKPSTIRYTKNGVLTGASFADVSSDTSVMQTDTSATAITGGQEQLALGLAKSDGKFIDLNTANFQLNPGDTLTVTGEASNTTIEGVVSFNFEELF